ncbi:MAG: A/G-specific adenine glycosylase [Bacteroidales bacterium]|jgi:A/G-specific adenine glycosylase|nr:A/G-specific adenine glycosylase [Bacteroidales bacterium]
MQKREPSDILIPADYKQEFCQTLRVWFEKNKRDLPWRDTNDPYRIWISEIILQQTRVAQGFDYYVRFIGRFPDVLSLADAEEDEVLKYWQGLGYYSRARNLHQAAMTIKNQFAGQFPVAHKEVLSLKGVGDYTAAAICSFAYGAPYAVVDGNVYRFLSRLLGIDEPIDSVSGKNYFASLAQQLLDLESPALHNQAIMEMGALQCVAASPCCTQCPFANRCFAYYHSTVDQLPVKIHKTKTRARYFAYFFLSKGDALYIQKRTGKDVWKNLYELPLVETETPVDEAFLADCEPVMKWLEGRVLPAPLFQIKHVLSHQVIHASFYELELSGDVSVEGAREIHKAELENYPVSRLIHLFLEHCHPELLDLP